MAVEFGAEAVRFKRDTIAPKGGARQDRIYASVCGTGTPMCIDAQKG